MTLLRSVSKFTSRRLVKRRLPRNNRANATVREASPWLFSELSTWMHIIASPWPLMFLLGSPEIKNLPIEDEFRTQVWWIWHFKLCKQEFWLADNSNQNAAKLQAIKWSELPVMDELSRSFWELQEDSRISTEAYWITEKAWFWNSTPEQDALAKILNFEPIPLPKAKDFIYFFNTLWCSSKLLSFTSIQSRLT